MTIEVEGTHSVSGLLRIPPQAHGSYVLAHGAGAGMAHPFMAAVADGLSERRIATLRFNFPFMEQGSKRPDRPALAQATVRASVLAASRLMPSLPLIAGGKSFGGRMASEAQAAEPLGGVVGLAFLGFPLHPANKPSDDRARHLWDVHLPMLFVQGTRDALADTRLLVPLARRLGERATLRLIEDADHSFRVPSRPGRTSGQVMADLCDTVAAWAAGVCGNA